MTVSGINELGGIQCEANKSTVILCRQWLLFPPYAHIDVAEKNVKWF